MSPMSSLRTMLTSLAISALWPSYLMVLSYAAKLAPWPRSIARLVAFVLVVSAVALYLTNILRAIFGTKGWVSENFQIPESVIRQLRAARTFLLLAAGLLLLPAQILGQGLIAPSGQPLYAHTVERFLILAFELSFLWASYRVVRQRGALAVWLTSPENPAPWLGRHRKTISWSLLASTALLIALDTQGYGFTARRLALAISQSLALIAGGWLLHRTLCTLITRHAWRWTKPTSPTAMTTEPASGSKDLSVRLKQAVHYVVPLMGLFIAAWIWEFDLALLRYVTEQKLWASSGETFVTVGDLFRSLLIFLVTGVLWKNLSTLFTLIVYPRITEDPGVRFAVLTLCRYVVLGVGTLAGLSAISLGLDKIGMVLAALGVGLGFGLQEIVSNFVSGLILLLERPLRVGDVVTVANMTGKVDRINIRATTIINADNQSMIIPNREFITGNLVNWTHKDKIIRVSITVAAAYGADPDRVSDLLLAIAREDPDVLGNPVACAALEEFGPGVLIFSLHVHVPDPSVAGRVKHRLGAQIQKRFRAAGIEIPLPKQEMRFHAADLEALLSTLSNTLNPTVAQAISTVAAPAPHIRIDRPATSSIESST